MKSFWKTLLAVILGMIIVSVVSVILLFGTLGGLAASGKSQPQVLKNTVLKIDLSRVVVSEQTIDMGPLASLQGPDVQMVGLLSVVRAIEAAAEDPNISFIYLKTDGNYTSLATLQELRRSLSDFRKSGKPVVSYIESPSTASYYMASVADKVYMTPHLGATVMVNGIAIQSVFLKDLLDKLGVNVQLIRHGKYKSAGETFVRSSSSAENTAQYRALVDGIWSSVASEVAQSRGITVEALNASVDGLKLCSSQDFVTGGLVDSLLTAEELKNKVATYAMAENFREVNMISLVDYIAARPILSKARKKIAVIYANGDIVDGNVEQNVAGDRFAAEIAKVRADSTVKAVVLRVNSPGGSVLASEKIKAELDLLRKDKPLIASYGDYAASGGYWISTGSDKIFTDEMTLTGSIGVFSMIPDFSKTAKNVAHVNVESFCSNKHGDMYSLMRPLDAAEQAYMQRTIEDVYARFVSIVAEARGKSADEVDELGQGRVWCGSDAVRNGLADEIGTLKDAIAYAAVAAGDPDLASWKIAEYPTPPSVMDAIMAKLSGTGSDDKSVFAATPFAPVASVFMKWSEDVRSGSGDYMFARLPELVTLR